MAKHSFTTWLQFEVHAARCALLKLIEEEDRIKYIERPQLEKQYMEAVGNYEETVVKEEMECELLTEKRRLIQAALNRREEIDEAAIDAKIDALRKEMTAEAAGTPPQDYAELSSEQSDALQELYGKIVKNFHPSMHPEMTQAHCELYQKAQDAYRHRDLPALSLIWEMLTASDGEGLQLAFEIVLGDTADDAAQAPKRDYTTDYSLAAELYSCFVPFREEAPITDAWDRFKLQINEKMEQIQALQQTFPYKAKGMLSDPQQIAAYRLELEQRMRQAQTERAQLTRGIQQMIGGVRKHG